MLHTVLQTIRIAKYSAQRATPIDDLYFDANNRPEFNVFASNERRPLNLAIDPSNEKVNVVSSWRMIPSDCSRLRSHGGRSVTRPATAAAAIGQG